MQKIQAKVPPSYTLDEVMTHNTPSDCWMAIEEGVYDLSTYLPAHEQMLDIESWCGTDATVDYNNKAGRNRDHSLRADQLLADYQIGGLSSAQAVETSSVPDQNLPKSVTAYPTYNVWLPLLGTIVVYLLTLKLLAKPIHSFLWNTVLLLGLIPSFIFGLILALNLDGAKMLYLHVEWSIVFGAACVLHLLYRLKIYLSQGKFALRKK